uniref:Peptidase A1 domain-containing protein n=1 Tax=Panagrolaimus davidi TaxID=227884 RepID=A0A914PPI5_9BILA
MGLGFQENADGNVVPPLINAINQGLLDEPLFTVYLNKEGSQEYTMGGVITYGALDTVHCSQDFSYYPLTSTKQFLIKLDSVTFGSHSFSTGWNVLIDTSTPLFGGPPNIIETIRETLGGTYDDDQGIFYINCNATFEPIFFSINGKQYPIKQEQLMFQLEPGKCILWLTKLDAEYAGFDWLFGYSWIRSFCTVFDFGQKRIGFAKTIL